MNYASNIAEDGRILSATYPRYVQDAVVVESLPEGDITEYRYVDGKYIHDPLPHPDPEPQKPTLEERIEVLETTTDDMVLLMAELIGG